MKLPALCIVVLLSFVCKSQGKPDYYWRDYTGIVPEDAVPGGYDLNGKTTYIGQGYLNNFGIIPTTIYAGEKNIIVPMQGAKTIDSYVRILCSRQPKSFKWMPVKADEFHVKMINKHPVLVGLEISKTISYNLYLGRIAFQGEVVIGKVVTGSPDTPGLAPMYFVSKNSEKRIDFYEILVYDETIHPKTE